MLSPAVTNIVVMLVMMQVSRRIDLENETNIMYVRTAYIVSVSLAYLVYFVVKQKIIAKNDQTKIVIHTPKNVMKNEPEKTEEKTVVEYDVAEIDAAIKSLFSSVGMMALMHFGFKFTNPILMQCLTPIKGALEHNETKIYLFGSKAEGALKRPFKTQGMFDAFLNKGSETETTATEDKPKIEELEDEKTK